MNPTGKRLVAELETHEGEDTDTEAPEVETN
jgi:hypothetical protein